MCIRDRFCSMPTDVSGVAPAFGVPSTAFCGRLRPLHSLACCGIAERQSRGTLNGLAEV